MPDSKTALRYFADKDVSVSSYKCFTTTIGLRGDIIRRIALKSTNCDVVAYELYEAAVGSTYDSLVWFRCGESFEKTIFCNWPKYIRPDSTLLLTVVARVIDTSKPCKVKFNPLWCWVNQATRRAGTVWMKKNEWQSHLFKLSTGIDENSLQY